MKDLIHFDEHREEIKEHYRRKGTLKFMGGASANDVLKVERINPYFQKPTKGQEEVYKYFKHKFILKEEVVETDLFEIWKKYSTRPSSWRHTSRNYKVDDERIYTNFNQFIKRAVGALVALGWFGLTFRKEMV